MRTALVLALATLSTSANAGTRAVFDERAEDRTITFEIDDAGDFRAGRDGQYRLVLGGEAYQVAEVDGQTYVAHVDDLAGALKETSSPFLRAVAKTFTFFGGQAEDEWVRLGRATVNGWQGREYRLQEVKHGFDADEDPFADMDATTVVVSDDPALQPVGEAMIRHTAEELRLKRHFVSGTAYDAVLDDLEELASLGTVIASSENDIQIVSIEEAEIAPERLALPAAPMEVAEIVALIRAKRNPFEL